MVQCVHNHKQNQRDDQSEVHISNAQMLKFVPPESFTNKAGHDRSDWSSAKVAVVMPCNCGTGPCKSIPVGRNKMGRGKCSTKKLPDIKNCLETQNHPRSDFTTSRLLDTQISRNTGNQNNFQLPYLCHHHGINCAQPGHLGADTAARERGAHPAARPCLAVKPR